MRSVEFAKTCNNPATTMPWRVKLFVGQTRRSCINRHDKKVAASGTCDILSTRTKTCISWITAGFKISDLQNIRQSRTSEYAISFLDLLIRSSATIQKLNFWFPKTGRWGSTYHHFLTIQFRFFCEHLSSVWAIVSPRSRAMKIWAMWSSDRRSGNGPPGPVWRHVGNFQDHRCRLDLFINFFRSRRSQVKMFFLLALVKNGERCVFFGGGVGRKKSTMKTYWTFGVSLSDVFNWLWQARWSVTHTDTNRNALCLAFYWSLQRSQDPSIVQRVNNGSMNRVFGWLVVGIVCVGVDLLQLIPIRLLFLPQD